MLKKLITILVMLNMSAVIRSHIITSNVNHNDVDWAQGRAIDIIRSETGDYWRVENERSCLRYYRRALSVDDGRFCKCPQDFPHFYKPKKSPYGCYASHEIIPGCMFTLAYQSVAEINRFKKCGYLKREILRFQNTEISRHWQCRIDNVPRSLTIFNGIGWTFPSVLTIREHRFGNEMHNETLVDSLLRASLQSGECVDKSEYILVSRYSWIVGHLVRICLRCESDDGMEEISGCLIGKAIGTHKHFIHDLWPLPDQTKTTPATSKTPSLQTTKDMTSATEATTRRRSASPTKMINTTITTPLTTVATETPLKSKSSTLARDTESTMNINNVTTMPTTATSEASTTIDKERQHTWMTKRPTLGPTSIKYTIPTKHGNESTKHVNKKDSDSSQVDNDGEEKLSNMLKISLSAGFTIILLIFVIVYVRRRKKQDRQMKLNDKKGKQIGAPSIKSTEPVAFNDEIYMELDFTNINENAYCGLNPIQQRCIKPMNAVGTTPHQELGNEPVYFETESEGPVYNEIPYMPAPVYFETYPDS